MRQGMGCQCDDARAERRSHRGLWKVMVKSWGTCYSGRMSLLASADIRECHGYSWNGGTNSNATDTI